MDRGSPVPAVVKGKEFQHARGLALDLAFKVYSVYTVMHVFEVNSNQCKIRVQRPLELEVVTKGNAPSWGGNAVLGRTACFLRLGGKHTHPSTHRDAPKSAAASERADVTRELRLFGEAVFAH